MEVQHLPRRWLHQTGSLFWPHRCPGCGRPLTDPGESVCLRCLFELPRTGFLQQPRNPVEMLFWGRTPVDAAGSLFYFSRGSAMQRILHALKYRGNRQAGVRLGRSLGDAIGASGRFSPIDAIIPVPLHPEREKTRGYNQAECIARGIADATGWPVWTGLVNRIRQTDTQTRKNRIERWSNLSDGFRLSRPEQVAGKHLLIVDDVITTGASLEACAQGILQASPAKLCIATIAYATQ